MIQIYKLVNPITKGIFYIGATSLPLKTRLSQHLAAAKHYTNRVNRYKTETIAHRKHELIGAITKAGFRPHIELVEITNINEVERKEYDYYLQFKAAGNNLLQSPKQCVYGKTVATRHANTAKRQSVINFFKINQ